MSSGPSDRLSPETDLNQSVGFVSAVFLIGNCLVPYLSSALPAPHPA